MKLGNNKTFGHLNISNKNTVKNVIMTFLPIFLFMVIEVIVSLVDTIIVFISLLNSDETLKVGENHSTIMTQTLNQPINVANMALAKFIIAGIVFALMYQKLIILPSNSNLNIRKHAKSNIICLRTIFLIISGYLCQTMVSSILSLCREHFVKQFAEYDKLSIPITGAGKSINMMICVILLAPIAEELLFRGLIQNYAKQYLSINIAIVFQALIFSVYHGNIIQGIYALIFGILLGFICQQSNSIIPGIILHISINASLYLVPASFTIDTTNSIITLIISVVVLVLISLMYRIISRLNKKQAISN